MEENLNSIAEYRIIPEFINNFSGDRKAWQTQAIVNILIADNQVSRGWKKIFQRCDNDFWKRRGSKWTYISFEESWGFGTVAINLWPWVCRTFFLFSGDSDCCRRKDKKTSKVKIQTSLCGKLGFSSGTAKAVLSKVTEDSTMYVIRWLWEWEISPSICLRKRGLWNILNH